MILTGLMLASFASASALAPASEDYSAFIAAQARRAAPGAAPGALVRALGVEDLLAARRDNPPQIAFSTSAPEGGTAKTALSFGTAAGVFHATLLSPAGGGKPRPAVLLFHGEAGGAAAARETVGRRLAEKGWTVLIPERTDALDPGREFDDAFNLLLLGRTLPGVRVYEAAVMLDYLSARPEVDRSKLAVVGLGTGGLLARLTAGADPRVAAVAADTALVEEPYFDWSADLMAPGLLLLALSAPSAPYFSGRKDLPGGELTRWLDSAFAGRAPAKTEQAPVDDPVERLFAAYKGYPPGTSEDVARYNLSVSLRRAGKIPEAIAELERGLARQPGRPLLLRGLAELYEVAGRREDAAKAAARLAESTPDSAEQVRTRASLARLYSRLGRLEDAREQYSRALRLEPDRPDLRAELSRVLIRLGRVEEGREQLAELVKRAPELVASRLELGKVLVQQGELAAGADQLERAAALAPDSAEVRLALGRLREMTGEDAAAEKELAAAWKAEPGSVGAGTALGGFLMEHKRFAEARKVFEDVLKRAPGVLDARMGLAGVLRAQNDAAGAAEQARKAAALDRTLSLDLSRQRRRCEALAATIEAVSAPAK